MYSSREYNSLKRQSNVQSPDYSKRESVHHASASSLSHKRTISHHEEFKITDLQPQSNSITTSESVTYPPKKGTAQGGDMERAGSKKMKEQLYQENQKKYNAYIQGMYSQSIAQPDSGVASPQQSNSPHLTQRNHIKYPRTSTYSTEGQEFYRNMQNLFPRRNQERTFTLKKPYESTNSSQPDEQKNPNADIIKMLEDQQSQIGSMLASILTQKLVILNISNSNAEILNKLKKQQE